MAVQSKYTDIVLLRTEMIMGEDISRAEDTGILTVNGKFWKGCMCICAGLKSQGCTGATVLWIVCMHTCKQHGGECEVLHASQECKNTHYASFLVS